MNDEDDEFESAAPGALMAQVGARRVTEETELRKGDLLEAKWDERWWPAEVKKALPDGRVSIHYTGWAASYDETVPRSRLRLEASELKTISVFGEGFSQSGLLVDDIERFLVLEIGNGAKQYVNKDKIVYFEVTA